MQKLCAARCSSGEAIPTSFQPHSDAMQKLCAARCSSGEAIPTSFQPHSEAMQKLCAARCASGEAIPTSFQPHSEAMQTLCAARCASGEAIPTSFQPHSEAMPKLCAARCSCGEAIPTSFQPHSEAMQKLCACPDALASLLRLAPLQLAYRCCPGKRTFKPRWFLSVLFVHVQRTACIYGNTSICRSRGNWNIFPARECTEARPVHLPVFSMVPKIPKRTRVFFAFGFLVQTKTKNPQTAPKAVTKK
eukprot:gene10644-biopygen22831